jgi:MFS family permease
MTELQPERQPFADPTYRGMLFGPLAGPTWLVVLGVGLHALAWFMVATAVPGTVAELGGAPLVAWLTTLFEGASIVAGAAGGLTKQRIGARRAMLTAVGLFCGGLLLAALAPSMEVVLAGRLLQGLGEGLVLALCYALIKDLFPERLVPRAFGLLAVVYAVAAFLGPVAAGALTDLLSWRAAFAATLVPAGALVVLVVRHLPPNGEEETRSVEPPLLRLALLAGAIFCLALAGNVAGWRIAALGATAPALLLTALWLDVRAAAPLMPRTAFRIRSLVGLAYWVILLMPVAASGAHVFAALFLVVLYGFSLTVAGYLVSLTALAWSGAALLVAKLEEPVQVRRCIAAGPLLQVSGLALTWVGFAVAWPDALAAALLAGGLATLGSGFGLCWAFLTQAIVRHTPAQEGDLAAGLVPTVEIAGFGIGAALAGMLANLGGIGDPLTAAAARAASSPIFGAGAAIAGIAAGAALVLVRRLRRLGTAAG